MQNKIIKIIKLVFILLFFSFLVLYISQKNGYYEFKNHEKNILTQKQIEKFEKDVKQGKDTSLDEYIVNTSPNYQNAFSKLGLNISNFSQKIIKKTVKSTFKILNKIVND